MEMNRTAYLPLRQFKKEEIVPTVKADYLRKGKVLQGYVHDESAAFMGGCQEMPVYFLRLVMWQKCISY